MPCMQTLQFHDTLRGRLLTGGVELRTRLLHLPYGDQGLLVHQDTLEVRCCVLWLPPTAP